MKIESTQRAPAEIIAEAIAEKPLARDELLDLLARLSRALRAGRAAD